MARTTSNEKRTIVTKGTQHEAFATSDDVCKLPGGKAQPFPNWVSSEKLAKGQTTTTFIDSQPVWTKVGELGPPSEPAHAGTAGGVKSGTYRFEARPTSYSKDVFMEGNAVVRAFDTTTQNHGNTVGIVVPAELAAQLRAMLGWDDECLPRAAEQGAPFVG